MEIIKSKINDVEVVEVNGRIDANNSKELENSLTEIIESGGKKLIVDLAKLDYISSSGLRVFLCIAKKLEKQGLIYLSALQPQVAQIFNISGFNNIFTIFKDKKAALDNLK
ncbi:MAG: STAS domain-containing protein [Bacteroidales bacterium]|nr:STAS domain-containing protein [Bacteroidales bacterium]